MRCGEIRFRDGRNRVSNCCKTDALAPVVIVGCGLAGYTLARELRKLDLCVPILMIARDDATFYTKPMLSNAFAHGRTPESLRLKDADAMADELDLQVCPNVEVLAIDRAQEKLFLDNGEQVIYRDLVLAVGADPIRLPLAGNAADDVLSVNDLKGFTHYVEKLAGVRHVAILGAGLIGCEFANDLLARGIEPTLIDPATWPLGRLLPQAAGEYLQSRLQHAGIVFHTGSTATRVDHADQGYLITLGNKNQIHADLVLSAVGLQPRTQLAKACGLLANRGIATDRTLRTSDPYIHALGDCAEVAGLALPFVQPIMHAARALAATLAGNPTRVVYPAMPVVVKTPACPTVIAPPPLASEGKWQIHESTSGLEARYIGENGELLGFALLGDATQQRAALAPRLPALLPA